MDYILSNVGQYLSCLNLAATSNLGLLLSPTKIDLVQAQSFCFTRSRMPEGHSRPLNKAPFSHCYIKVNKLLSKANLAPPCKASHGTSSPKQGDSPGFLVWISDDFMYH